MSDGVTGSADRRRVVSGLQTQFEAIRSADPFRVLGLDHHAGVEDIRHAYVRLTKVYHPNRFALEDPHTRDLANEVYLVIRRAYDLLLDDAGRQRWRERVAPSPTGANPRPHTTPAVSGALPPVTAVSSGLGVGTIRPGGPPPVQTTPMALPDLTPPPNPGQTRTGKAPTNPPPAAPAPRSPPRVSTQPTSSRTPTIPGSPGSVDVQGVLDQARTRAQRFEDALQLMHQGRYKEAREALFIIAAEDPQSKRYRTQLHLAWAFEHKLEGKRDDYKRELERALDLDPECHEAKAALAKLEESSGGGANAGKKKGLFGKLFGK
jgi:hypothetical protein